MATIACCCASAINAQVTSTITTDDLAKVLFEKKAVPKVRLTGSFRFYSAFDTEDMRLVSSSKFLGVIDLALRTTHFDLYDYISPVTNDPQGTKHSLYSVTYDGEKWVTSDATEGVKLPYHLLSLTDVTKERPRLFLKTLDQLCFPLFSSLSDVQVGNSEKPFLQALTDPDNQGKIKIERRDKLVVVRFEKSNLSDEFIFDPSKGYAFCSRKTSFGPSNANETGDNLVINEMKMDHLQYFDGIWMPSTAEFTQTLNGKLIIKRDYVIEDSKVLIDGQPIQSILPADTYVTDQRFGVSYRTGDKSPKAQK